MLPIVVLLSFIYSVYGIRSHRLIESIQKEINYDLLKQAANNTLEVIDTPSPDLNISLLNHSQFNHTAIHDNSLPEYGVVLITLGTLCALAMAYPAYLKIQTHIQIKKQRKIDRQKKERKRKQSLAEIQNVIDNTKDDEIMIFEINV